MRGSLIRMLAAGGAALLLAGPARAIFINAWQPVPLERLFKNVSKHVSEQPRDPAGHYTMGRLHSLAFARTVNTAQVKEGDRGPLPSFPPYESIKVQPQFQGEPSKEALKHLVRSIKEYRRATELAPENSLYWMGLGWMLEQGAPHADRVAAPFKSSGKAGTGQWLLQALTAYRKAHALDLASDLKGHYGPGADTSISLEAGEGILRILSTRKPTPAIEAEQQKVKEMVAQLKSRPRAVTPIVFPLDGHAPLSGLIAEGSSVSFDLAGDGRGERWAWPNAQAGILVWDPLGTGRITSGHQLFGSVTWSMYWSDGYEPLAALDDDRSGWLEDGELKGISVWRDGNGNAVSETGEVRPLSHYDITRISVRASGRGAGGPFNRQGLQLRDGAFAPTYDWSPTSLPRQRGSGR